MQQRRTPFSLKVNYEIDFFKQYQYLAQNETYHAFLESGRGGRYSIAGIKPIAIAKGKDEELVVRHHDIQKTFLGNPLDSFQEWFQQFSTINDPKLPDFQGGAIGFLSYDCVRYFEKLPNLAEDDLQTPDLYFMIFDDVAIYDHQESVLWLITHTYNDDEKSAAYDKLNGMKAEWTSATQVNVLTSLDTPSIQMKKQLAFTEKTFMHAVEKIKSYIAQGDVFQINLSVRQDFPLTSDPMKIYEALRMINPSPYMGYLNFPEFQLVSSSPELLVKKQGKNVSTRPIAGTRSRGRDEHHDQQLANELIQNEKERAEHVMLVDLERNDLGRVCGYGTVHVNEFMVIEKYSHVMHIVSNVEGQLRDDCTYAELIKATFPGGTITGAPKVRTMQIIEELEPTRRGIYTGSIGWIGFNGDTELNIIIRTLLAKDGVGYVQSGAGIVIDSNPEHEYKESLKKAKAMMKAVELSSEEKILSLR
ncbi:aminodeoxychorismate synthase, component I [Metabacillus herbersteinensis]|uniref:Aminodeoxychorismate synthase, component I n=1 Tax=Metabacillus herbersteinensis TaxID=283816 RepID=A0ABV6GLD7_9BACI